jgi:hypothetical protein
MYDAAQAHASKHVCTATTTLPTIFEFHGEQQCLGNGRGQKVVSPCAWRQEVSRLIVALRLLSADHAAWTPREEWPAEPLP